MLLCNTTPHVHSLDTSMHDTSTGPYFRVYEAAPGDSACDDCAVDAVFPTLIHMQVEPVWEACVFRNK